jgi:hypothetical protein
MKKILVMLSCLLSVNCFADEKEITPTPLQAAVADTASTVIGLNNGFVELNPLGVYGATIAKGILLFVVNDKFEGEDKILLEKAESSSWTGLAVNNFALILGFNPVFAVCSGVFTALVIWKEN